MKHRRAALKPSKTELAFLDKRLRYMNPGNIAKDFKSSAERKAHRRCFQMDVAQLRLRMATQTALSLPNQRKDGQGILGRD